MRLLKVKEQTVEMDNDSAENLANLILAIAKLPFENKIIFKILPRVMKELLEKQEETLSKVRKLGNIIDTDLSEGEFSKTGNEIFLMVKILPALGAEYLSKIYLILETGKIDKQAYFKDSHPRAAHYRKFLKNNEIRSGKKLSIQKAYDKLCELSRNELNRIPKINF